MKSVSGGTVRWVGCGAFAVSMAAATAAWAQESPESSFPSGSTAPRTMPAESSVPSRDGSMPPFTSPLPPSVPFPPPIQLVPAVPPPIYGPLPNPWTVPPVVPERTTPPVPRRMPEHPELLPNAAGGLRQALAEYDRRLGLARSGAVLSAARRVGMGETALGSARFEIVVDRSGTIQTAEVVDASRDLEGWQRFAANLQATRVAGLRLPQTANGVWMLLDISAEHERASGRRYWWDYGLTLAFDVADLGEGTLRIVRTSVASEMPF